MVSAIPAEVALARLSDDDRRAVEQFRDELRSRYGARIKDIRLYGSKVRGDAALLDAGFVLGAVSRLYYAVFHAARAALLVHGRHTRTHTGQVTQFNATFGSEPLLGELLGLRIVADYKPLESDTDEADARDLLGRATAFVERCRGIVAAEVARGVHDPDPLPDL